VLGHTFKKRLRVGSTSPQPKVQ